MRRDYNIIDDIAKRSYKEVVQTVTGTMARLNDQFSYMDVPRPSDIPSNAVAELRETDGWGWLVKMGGSTSGLRFLSPGQQTSARTLKVVWRYPIWGGVPDSPIFNAFSHFFKTEEVAA